MQDNKPPPIRKPPRIELPGERPATIIVHRTNICLIARAFLSNNARRMVVFVHPHPLWPEQLQPVCDRSCGALWVLKRVGEHVGITQALGKSTHAQRALFLVLARIAHQGSRLSAVRWAKQY
ncbi:MAG: hypothetical protein MJD61_03200 [Proteobacteria bacterium]|nr:hypothetical protein [Pseudomonadota bacterium]